MNRNEIAEMDKLRRFLATIPEPWKNIGAEIYTLDGVYIGHFRETAWAIWTVRVHNMFLPVANMVVMQRKKLNDRKAISNE